MPDPRFDRKEADAPALMSLVARLETKLQTHKTEIESLQARIGALEKRVAELQKNSGPPEPWLGTQGGLPR
jgi:polyhydroxyalkanoate synthesis regulator phasin